MQVISEDHYTIEVVYGPGSYTYAKDKIGTRYVGLLIRVLANPEDETDLKAAHAVQDGIKVEQASAGKFEIPDWDPVSQTRVRNSLKSLAAKASLLEDKISPLTELRQSDPPVMFGTEEEVDPIAHLMGTAVGWGGNPPSAAVYEGFFPARNDGKIVHRLTLKDVPVDGFWSVSVYNAEGFFEKNDLSAYSLNNLTAEADPNGSVTVLFGGCQKDTPNCLPVTEGWNYTVRLYRPRSEILDGSWKLPEAQALN
jgi:para-nitrobenzyl esterase